MPPPSPNIKVMPTENKPKHQTHKTCMHSSPRVRRNSLSAAFRVHARGKIAFREFHQAHTKIPRICARSHIPAGASVLLEPHTRGAAAMPSHRARRTRDLNERPPPHIIRSIMFGAQTCLCQCARYERVCVRVCERAHEKRKTHTVQNTRKNYVMQLAQFVGAQTNTPTLHNML